jgi:hypothetical protein
MWFIRWWRNRFSSRRKNRGGAVFLATCDKISKRRGEEMHSTLKVSVSSKEMIDAVKSMKKKERDAFLEDLLASTSPEYLQSIKEARADYKAGRVKTHREVWGD